MVWRYEKYTITSSVIMAALTGTMYRTPSSPRGISRLSAASGPYAAELRPSRPKMGMPWAGPNLLGSFVAGFDGLARQLDQECS